MEPLADRLALIHKHIARAAEAAHGPGVSPVLAAVVDEFLKKSTKLAAGAPSLLAIVELEQAGDSAKAAAGADPGASDEVKRLVGVAHDSICLLKHEQAQQQR
jgi:hypothetical protein